ncbi:MAG: NUDIX hydrolase [Lentisphaeria bacterium]|jgi:8-oxo-dGTP pyrophosphatase MutT (NUDIX family)|nr:NUDIX hydrolase [Lentisphaeria bacterium]
MKILDRTAIASGGWISLQKIRYLGHDGKVRTWESACRINSRGAVMMIPVTRPGDKLIIVRQFRPPTGRLVYEFPAGLINPGEDPCEAAVRELKEETGYVGTVEYCSPQVFTSPGLSSEFVHLVRMSVDPEAQQDLATHFDESEYIETFLVGQDELADFIRQAETDGYGVDTKIYMWAISRGCPGL